MKYHATWKSGLQELDLGQLESKLLVKDFTSHKFEIFALTFTDESNKFIICQIILSNSGVAPRTDFESLDPSKLTRLNDENFSSIFLNNTRF